LLVFSNRLPISVIVGDGLDMKRYGGFLKAVRVTAIVLVVGFSSYYLGRNILQGLDDLLAAAVRINYCSLAISLLLTVGCTILGAWEWQLLLRGLGHDLGARKGMRIHLLASVAKYAPGYLWQILGKVYLSERQSVSRKRAVASVGVEFSLIVVTGTLLALMTLPSTGLLDSPLLPNLGPGIALILVPLAVLPLLLPALRRASSWSQIGERFPIVNELNYTLLVGVTVAIYLTWLVLGLGFVLLIDSVYPISANDIPTYIFALAASFILGLLALFAPSGIGVRESTMAFLLGSCMPLSVASVIAILARVVTMFADAACFVVGLGL
jgi:hypothetical protein